MSDLSVLIIVLYYVVLCVYCKFIVNSIFGVIDLVVNSYCRVQNSKHVVTN